MLGHLKDTGVARAICTNKSRRLALHVLRAADLMAFFSPAAIVGFDTVSPPKPAPDALLHLMMLHGAAPGMTWMVGDSAADIAAARAAGVWAVACSWGYGDAAGAAPDRIVTCASEIPSIVQICA